MQQFKKLLTHYFKLVILIFGFYFATMSIGFAANEGYYRLTQDPAVRQLVQDLSMKYNFNRGYLYSLISQAHFDDRVINKMQLPYEKSAWLTYKKHFITPERVYNGVLFWYKNRDVLKLAESKYGIPADIIVAILGIETKYGQEQGTYNALNTLVTLAFYYPPKAKFFQKELGAFIVLSHQNHFNPFAIRSSYAGALGIPQFMPSSYLDYGVGYPNLFKANLFSNPKDAILSVANFLMQKGWENDQPIAVSAKLVGKNYESLVKQDANKPIEPSLNLENFAEKGVYDNDANDSRINPYWRANLMKFAGEKPEYWLGFNNFYVLTQYNNSDLYAMTVFELGKVLQKEYRSYLDSQAKKVSLRG